MQAHHHSYPPLFLLLSTICLLNTLASASASASASAPDTSPAVGTRTEVPHVESNRKVQSLGQFSVAQYNYRLRKNVTAGAAHHARPLTFSRVVEAEEQVVAGIKYFLKVVAKYGKYSTTEKSFDAVVLVQPWLKSKELLSFTPSP